MSLARGLIGVLPIITAISQAADGSAVHETPMTLSTADYESTPTFSPDGRDLFFFRGDPAFRRYRLFHSTCHGGSWTVATEPAFAAPPGVDEADPSFTADGRRLYYVSAREDSRPRGEADFDIWFVDRDERGRWGAPGRLPEPVNSPGAELLPRPQPDGSLWFGSDRPGGRGGYDIYVAHPAGAGWRVENAGPPVNTAANEYEAELSADARLLIVVADAGGRSHLHPYRRDGPRWIAQPPVVPRADVFQVGPLLSPRADRLLFAQADGGRSGEWFVLDLAPAPDRAWPPRCGS